MGSILGLFLFEKVLDACDALGGLGCCGLGKVCDQSSHLFEAVSGDGLGGRLDGRLFDGLGESRARQANADDRCERSSSVHVRMLLGLGV
jgi:hypothetical protein